MRCRQPTFPASFSPRTLRRRALQAIAALAVLVAIVVFAPGLGEVRDRLAGAETGVAGARDVARGRLVRVLRGHVRADLLHRPGLAAKLADRRRRAGDGLAGSGQRRRRAGARCLDPSPGRHGRGADRAPLRRLLPDQERRQLPRRRGDRDGDGDWPGRAGAFAVADRRSRRRSPRSRSVRWRAARGSGPGAPRRPGGLAAAPRGERRAAGGDRPGAPRRRRSCARETDASWRGPSATGPSTTRCSGRPSMRSTSPCRSPSS